MKIQFYEKMIYFDLLGVMARLPLPGTASGVHR